MLVMTTFFSQLTLKGIYIYLIGSMLSQLKTKDGCN